MYLLLSVNISLLKIQQVFEMDRKGLWKLDSVHLICQILFILIYILILVGIYNVPPPKKDLKIYEIQSTAMDFMSLSWKVYLFRFIFYNLKPNKLIFVKCFKIYIYFF